MSWFEQLHFAPAARVALNCLELHFQMNLAAPSNKYEACCALNDGRLYQHIRIMRPAWTSYKLEILLLTAAAMNVGAHLNFTLWSLLDLLCALNEEEDERFCDLRTTRMLVAARESYLNVKTPRQAELPAFAFETLSKSEELENALKAIRRQKNGESKCLPWPTDDPDDNDASSASRKRRLTGWRDSARLRAEYWNSIEALKQGLPGHTTYTTLPEVPRAKIKTEQQTDKRSKGVQRKDRPPLISTNEILTPIKPKQGQDGKGDATGEGREDDADYNGEDIIEITGAGRPRGPSADQSESEAPPAKKIKPGSDIDCISMTARKRNAEVKISTTEPKRNVSNAKAPVRKASITRDRHRSPEMKRSPGRESFVTTRAHYKAQTTESSSPEAIHSPDQKSAILTHHGYKARTAQPKFPERNNNSDQSSFVTTRAQYQTQCTKPEPKSLEVTPKKRRTLEFDQSPNRRSVETMPKETPQSKQKEKVKKYSPISKPQIKPGTPRIAKWQTSPTHKRFTQASGRVDTPSSAFHSPATLVVDASPSNSSRSMTSVQRRLALASDEPTSSVDRWLSRTQTTNLEKRPRSRLYAEDDDDETVPRGGNTGLASADEDAWDWEDEGAERRGAAFQALAAGQTREARQSIQTLNVMASYSPRRASRPSFGLSPADSPQRQRHIPTPAFQSSSLHPAARQPTTPGYRSAGASLPMPTLGPYSPMWLTGSMEGVATSPRWTGRVEFPESYVRVEPLPVGTSTIRPRTSKQTCNNGASVGKSGSSSSNAGAEKPDIPKAPEVGDSNETQSVSKKDGIAKSKQMQEDDHDPRKGSPRGIGEKGQNAETSDEADT